MTCTERELWLWRRTRAFNVPRNLLLAGTAVSWYVGIVWCNGDLSFKLLNVARGTVHGAGVAGAAGIGYGGSAPVILGRHARLAIVSGAD